VFAFSNNEEVSILSAVQVTIRPLLPAGAIEKAELMCGPDCAIGLQREVPQAMWKGTVPSMRPLATWIIDCQTNGKEGDVEFEVRFGTDAGSGQSLKTLGRRPSRQRPKLGVAMRLLATLGALGMYLGEKAVPWHQESSWRTIELSEVDAVMLTMIALAGVVTIVIMRPPAQAPVFGYMTTRRQDAEGRAGVVLRI
jgi:hypothetical protein